MKQWSCHMDLPIVKRLLETTEQMANHASVDMQLWDKHSNACLDSAKLIEALAKALEPFAKKADDYNPLCTDKMQVTFGGSTNFTLAEYRAARAALSLARSEQKQNGG